MSKFLNEVIDSLPRYWKLGIIFCLHLLINGCSFVDVPIGKAEIKKLKAHHEQTMNQSNQEQSLPITAQLLINDQNIIDLEVAVTPEQQALGLMYRSSLAENRGMLFDFKEPIIASFWMKNVSISLDMIFVSNGVVNSIAHNVPPCTENPCPAYYSEGFINQVIELAGGRAVELDIQPGDRLEIVFLDNNNKN